MPPEAILLERPRAAAPAPRQIVPAPDPDAALAALVREWEAADAEAHRLNDIYDRTDDRGDLARTDAAFEVADALFARVAAAPAAGAAGILLKARIVRTFTVGTAGHGEDMFIALLADLERMAAVPSSAAGGADPHPRWLAEAHGLLDLMEGLPEHEATDEKLHALGRRRYPIEDRLYLTPALTIPGVRAQVAGVLRAMVDQRLGDAEEAGLRNAVAALGRLAAPVPAAPDPHVAWLAEHERLCAVTAAAAGDEAEHARLCGRILDLRDLAASTPAATVEGARAMLGMAARADEDQDAPGMAALARSALAALDRLARGDALAEDADAGAATGAAGPVGRLAA